MEEEYTKVLQHLSGVADSIYPPSMLALTDMLCSAKQSTIRCALANFGDCKLKSLAQNIVSALEYDISAISVLEKLALEKSLRDAVLDCSQGTLDVVLKAACSSEKAFNNYNSVALSMLSHPLPPTILLPPSIKQFLTLLTTSLARCPSSTNLNGLYMLLSAHPTTLPHFLHTTHQRTIHAVLSKCLVNSDPLIKFLAIACIALIAQHEPPDDSQDHPGSLFDGAKGMKVLKLGISTVLAELATPKEESVKIIRLCGISVNVLDQRLICEWLEMKGSGQQIKKLKDKVKGIKDGELLAAYFEFLYGLQEKALLAEFGLPELLERLVESMLCGALYTESCFQAVTTAIQSPSCSSLHPFFLSTIEKMYVGTQHPQYAVTLLIAYTQLLSASTDFAMMTGSKFAENHFSSVIDTFLSRNPSKQSLSDLRCPSHGPSCIRHTTRQNLILESHLCTFIIRLGFTQTSFLEQDTLVSAINKLTYLSSLLPLLECSSPARSTRFPALLEESATPQSHPTSHSWRETLSAELLREAQSKYDNILNTVGLVCRDLELRCSNVEQPLRQAESQLQNVTQELQRVHEEKLRLEESCKVLVCHNEELRGRQESLLYEVRCIKGEKEAYEMEVRELRSETEGLLREFEGERRSWREREEEILMTNKVLDEELKEAQVKILDGEKINYQLEQEKVALNEQIDEIGRLMKEAESSWEGKLKAQETLTADKENELNSLKTNARDLETKLSNAREELDLQKVTSRKALERAVEESDLKLSSLRDEYDQKISSLQTQWELKESKLMKENEKLETEARRLTRQIASLKRRDEEHRKEVGRMMEAQDRLQRAVAEMNTLRIATRNVLDNVDVDSLSQQLSQIPGDLSGGQQQHGMSSPVGHRAKRSRITETPSSLRRQRIPLAPMDSRTNMTPAKQQSSGKKLRSSSVTQDEEPALSSRKKRVTIGSEYGDLIGDGEGFSQFVL